MRKIAISHFGGPEVLELVEVPVPTLDPEDVLVKAHAIGVGWPDVYVRTGTYPWQHLFPMPATPGVEMSGTVAAVRELGADKHALVLSLTRAGTTTMFPSAQTVLETDDAITVQTTPERLRAIHQLNHDTEPY